jgi:predicted ABC-type ATPase
MTGYVKSLPASSSVISGIPAPILYAMDAVADAPNLIVEGIKELVAKENKEINKDLISAGHREYVNAIKVYFDPKDLSIVYRLIGDDVHTIEYGDQDTPAKGVYRSLVLKRTQNIERKIELFMKNALGEM